MKSPNQTLRAISITLGNPIYYFAAPVVISFVLVGLIIRHFKNELPGLLAFALQAAGALPMAFLLVQFFMINNGKRILGAIEKDYGPRTRLKVYETFAKAEEGKPISLDIPGIARAYRESE
jgi:hypothetical protein